MQSGSDLPVASGGSLARIVAGSLRGVNAIQTASSHTWSFTVERDFWGESLGEGALKTSTLTAQGAANVYGDYAETTSTFYSPASVCLMECVRARAYSVSARVLESPPGLLF